METMDFSIAKKICVAYNIYKGEDIMERIQKRKNAVAFADAINSIAVSYTHLTLPTIRLV